MKLNRFAFFLCIACFVLAGLAYAQEPAQNNTKRETATGSNLRAALLNKQARKYLDNNPDTAEIFAVEALLVAEDLSDTREIYTAQLILRDIALKKGNNEKAARHNIALLRHYENTRDTTQQITILKELEAHYLNAGVFESALHYQFALLELYKDKRDVAGQAEVYNQMGILFRQQRRYEESLQQYRIALKLIEGNNDYYPLLGLTYDNLGGTHYYNNDTDSALLFFRRAYQIRKQIGNPLDIAKSLNNLGLIYKRKGDYEQALSNFIDCYETLRETGDISLFSTIADNIGDTYLAMGKVPLALKFHQEALNYALRSGNKEQVIDSYESLVATHLKMNDYKTAFNYERKINILKDSIYNEQSARQVAEMTSRYNSEQKEKEIALLNRESKIKDFEIRQERNRYTVVVGALVFSVVIGLLAINSVRLKNKSNRLLQQQNTEISMQKEEITAQRDSIEEKNRRISETMVELGKKNKDITSSINYASRIQNATLPHLERIRQVLPDTFIFFRPRNIVSGDFYWFTELEVEARRKILIAAADCTGHGVPGAFMSLVGSNLLNEIVNVRRITSPELILTELDEGVRERLRQNETSGRDGMDIALCVIDLQGQYMEFAGAKNPLQIVRDGTLITYHADRMSIGGTVREKTTKHFSRHRIDLRSGDMCYIYSDGFQDQFGGPEYRKFMSKYLKSLLVELADREAEQQRLALEHTLDNWKQQQPQTDDILIIGFKVHFS